MTRKLVKQGSMGYQSAASLPFKNRFEAQLLSKVVQEFNRTRENLIFGTQRPNRATRGG